MVDILELLSDSLCDLWNILEKTGSISFSRNTRDRPRRPSYSDNSDNSDSGDSNNNDSNYNNCYSDSKTYRHK
jgi:hypothetical protein